MMKAMSKYTVKLTSSKEIAEGTMAFTFSKPEGFEYRAGQYCDWTEIDPPQTDAEGPKRSFSLSSAPHEPELMITSRMRDTAFKNVLKDAAPGLEISMDGPLGSFTLQADASRPAVFLTGGIGVTPVFSILKDAAERNLPHKIWLFYSNRNRGATAFLDELEALQGKNPNFKLVATMTDPDNPEHPWSGEHGYIDGAMLDRHLEAGAKPIWYMTGPPPMVAAMRKLLASRKISEDDIRFEEFSGY